MIRRQEKLVTGGLSGFMTYVFSIMGVGILWSMFCVFTSGELILMPIVLYFGSSGILFISIISMIALYVIDSIFSKNIETRSTHKSLQLFGLNTTITGIFLSPLYIIAKYVNFPVIAQACFGTVIIFLSVALYSYFSKKDFTTWNGILTTCSIALLFITLAKIVVWMFNPALARQISLLTSLFGIIISTLFIMSHISMLKSYYYNHSNDSVALSRVGIFGAVLLFNEFVNLFIFLVHILLSMGDNKKK